MHLVKDLITESQQCQTPVTSTQAHQCALGSTIDEEAVTRLQEDLGVLVDTAPMSLHASSTFASCV